MKNLVLFLLFFWSMQFSAQPPVEWATAYGDTQYDQASDMVVDAEGNVYITGTYNGTIDIDPGPNEELINSLGSQSMFVQKLSSTGELVWYYALNSGSTTNGYGIEVDNQGNVYVVGYFQSAADFDTGPGVSFLVAVGTSGGFVLKLNASGTFAWAVGMLGSFGGDTQKIAFDGNNAIYVCGLYAGTIDVNPGTPTTNLTSTGGLDLYIVKLSLSGNYVWSGSIGADEYQNVSRLEVDNEGNLIVGGDFAGSGDFDPTTGTSTLTTNSYTEIFLVKIDNAGAFIFAHAFGGTDNEELSDIAIDSENHIFLVGHFNQTADFDINGTSEILTSNGSSDLFLIKLNPDASLNWARGIGSTTTDVGGSITIDDNDNLYLTMNCYLSIDFDLSDGVSTFTGPVGGDIAIAKYNQNAELTWVSLYGGDSTEEPAIIRAFAEDVLYLIGVFYGTLSFSEEPNAPQFVSAGEADIFVLRLSCTSYGTENTTACNEYVWPVNGNSYTSSGTYEGVITNFAGCDSIITLNLTINSVNNAVNQNGTTMTAAQNNASYQWFLCDTKIEFIEGATNQSYTATANGSYGVQVTVDDCTVISDCITFTDIAVENSRAAEFSISPNPASTNIIISSTSPIHSYSIVDSQGRMIHDELTNGSKISFDVSHLAHDVYILTLVNTNGQIATKKLIIN
jgi:Secretion system C-terminal sorting domain/Beta-propeller repeat